MSVTHGLRFDRASFTHRPSCCGDSDLVSSAVLGRGSSPSFGGDFCVWLGLRRGLLRLGDVSDSRSSGGLMWAAENRCGDTKGDPADGEVDRAGMGMACSFLPVLLRRRSVCRRPRHSWRWWRAGARAFFKGYLPFMAINSAKWSSSMAVYATAYEHYGGGSMGAAAH